jgi:transcriptional regulator with XRE-family HTH domain
MNIYPLNKKIGENIERCRLQRKKNIKEMASLLGLTKTGYRNIEKGVTEAGKIKYLKYLFINY